MQPCSEVGSDSRAAVATKLRINRFEEAFLDHHPANGFAAARTIAKLTKGGFDHTGFIFEAASFDLAADELEKLRRKVDEHWSN